MQKLQACKALFLFGLHDPVSKITGDNECVQEQTKTDFLTYGSFLDSILHIFKHAICSCNVAVTLLYIAFHFSIFIFNSAIFVFQYSTFIFYIPNVFL